MLQDISFTEIPVIKVFLNYIDLYQNYEIAKYLMNSETTIEFRLRFAISGTIYDHESNGIAEFKKQMSHCLFKTVHDFIDHIIENEFIIYDISTYPTEITEIEKVLEALQKLYENDVENKLSIKYFILLSTPLTWGTTEARNDEGVLHESEYPRRRAHPLYMKHKQIERTVNIFEKKMQGKVRTLIICPGYSFGGVNDIFHYIFKLAYFNKQKVPIVEPGHQIIPLIYIKDLARIIGQIIREFPPSEKRYIFAVQPHLWSIKAFTRSVVNSVSGNLMRVGILPKNCLMKYEDDVFPQRVIDAITTPLKFVPSYLKKFEFTFTKPDEIEKILVNEYRIERNLLPIKILIDGPPLSGKTVLAKELAEYYNLNYVDPSTAIQLVINRLQKDITIGDKLLFNLEREKIEIGNEKDNDEVKQIEENIKELLEEWKDCLVDLTNHMVDEEKDQEDILKYKIKCLKKILSSKLYCENQGYIIDGFPFTYNQASDILFDSDVDEEEGENDEKDEIDIYREELEEKPFKKFKTSPMMPNCVVLLDVSDELIWQRGMQLSLEESLRHGNNEEGICKRLEEFRKRDEHEDTSLINFFYDNNVAPLSIVLNEDSKYDMLFEMIKDKIGPPHTYPLTPFEKAKLKYAEIDRQKRAEKEFQRKQNEIQNKVRMEREAKLKQWTTEFEFLKREEDLAAEARTLPLRQYLAKFVLPTLTEGILEVTLVKPDDPVDYLAEFLFKSNKTGHVLSDAHTEEMKKLLLDEGKESVLNILDNYVLNENEFKCTDFQDEATTSKK